MLALDQFDYQLPVERIAQTPAIERDAARLLDAGSREGPLTNRIVRDLPELVGPGDLIVVNESRVIPARLNLFKTTGAVVEVLLLEPLSVLGTDNGIDRSCSNRISSQWQGLVRPSRRVRPGTVLVDSDGTEVLEVRDELGDGLRALRSVGQETLLEAAGRLGRVPLPPYITSPLVDPERYQTVYSRSETSAAAPTAGLHLTDDVLQRCIEAGAATAAVELAVGLGTFRPISSQDVSAHQMHAERYVVQPEILDACAKADRVIAIGTTTTRALESACRFGAGHGSTELFIKPGFDFEVVDVLFTNFHQPRSSLLVMLAAFAGDRWRVLYEHALECGYRFLSFGDAMIVSRSS